MKYLFLNKNYKLLEFEYNEAMNVIEKIISFYDKDRLPYSLNKSTVNNFNLKLTSWLNNRYSKNSPWYKQIEWKYNYLIINDLIIKSYGLSLSDQYWIKPINDNTKWEDVNFFDNNFNDLKFINNLDRVYDYKDVDVLYTPNITTGGELNKAWAIDNNNRVLYKSSNTFYGLETD